MVADGKWFEWTLFLTILYIVRLCDGSDYCKHYVACQQRLELEERQCVRLKNSNKYQNKTECLMLIDGARAAVDGLQLRKTELEKDCAMRNSGGDSLGLTYFQRVQCERAIEKLLSKMPSSEFIYKFSNEYVKHEDLKGCRKLTKLLRKHCRALSQCCTAYKFLTEYCHKEKRPEVCASDQIILKELFRSRDDSVTDFFRNWASEAYQIEVLGTKKINASTTDLTQLNSDLVEISDLLDLTFQPVHNSF